MKRKEKTTEVTRDSIWSSWADQKKKIDADREKAIIAAGSDKVAIDKIWGVWADKVDKIDADRELAIKRARAHWKEV